MKVPKKKHSKVGLLFNEINQAIYGKATFTPEHGYVTYRCEQLLDDEDEILSEQLDSLIRIICDYADLFYHAVLLVIGGETIEDAVRMSSPGAFGTG